MAQLALHEIHQSRNARFTELNGAEAVHDYGVPLAEHSALRDAVGVLDLSFRSRLCLTGADRQKFLNGQVTNNVKDLKSGEGCYAALVNAKGKMHSDLNIFLLEKEILLDFEPGYSAPVSQRLEKYIIADDVQVVDVAPHYGLLSIQGPKAGEVALALGLDTPRPGPLPAKRGEGAQRAGEGNARNAIQPGAGIPAQPFAVAKFDDAILGEIYLVKLPRTGSDGFDLFVPTAALGAAAGKLITAAEAVGGRACGWRALEIARIEAGIPRFGVDMDEMNLAPEAGIEERAISYTKGCYIGQEVIARIRTYGQVARSLRGLRLADDLKSLPVRGDKLFKDGREVGHVTSAVESPRFKANIALGYVRKECNQPGQTLDLNCHGVTSKVEVVMLPFRHE